MYNREQNFLNFDNRANKKLSWSLSPIKETFGEIRQQNAKPQLKTKKTNEKDWNSEEKSFNHKT